MVLNEGRQGNSDDKDVTVGMDNTLKMCDGVTVRLEKHAFKAEQEIFSVYKTIEISKIKTLLTYTN
jgi:hypothetical protein